MTYWISLYLLSFKQPHRLLINPFTSTKIIEHTLFINYDS
jgi:hypothetical protein